MAPIIGFDFDLCIAEAWTLVPFILILETLLEKELAVPNISKSSRFLLTKGRDIFYKKIADNEIKTGGVIFRPSMLKLLPIFLKMRQQGKIDHLFIYSNNKMNQLIDVCDHILALILQKPPYSVKRGAFVNEKDKRIHTLTPRIHIDHPCRNSETLEGKFKEKKFKAIRECLGENIHRSDLWFIDDTEHHTQLINELQERYVVVEPYEIKISNKKLAEMFIESFTIQSFAPNSSTSAIFLKIINIVLPGFVPTGIEYRAVLIDKLTHTLNTTRPEGSGELIPGWTPDHVQSDYIKLEAAFKSILIPRVTLVSNILNSYKAPIGGSTNPNSRRNRNRILRTRRKTRK
jgi:hypothetical protein